MPAIKTKEQKLKSLYFQLIVSEERAHQAQKNLESAIADTEVIVKAIIALENKQED